jgi:hypothetical protein
MRYGACICANNQLTYGNIILNNTNDTYPSIIADNILFYGTPGVILTAGNADVHGNQTQTPSSDTIKLYKNTSGITLADGLVVIMGATGETYDGTQYTITTTAGDDKVLGIVYIPTADDNYGPVQSIGKTSSLKVNGTMDIAPGDFLCTSSWPGISQKAVAGDMAFAIALEAYTDDSSVGVIDAILITPRKL